MVKLIEQGTIIIIDIGRNVAEADEKESKSFFEEARECAVRILERKIISFDKSLVGIILLGTVKTKNSMADQVEGAFRHIELLAELQAPNFQMIKHLPKEPTKKKGDWFDGLIVAADHIKTGVPEYKIAKKKIILITNFKSKSTVDANDLNQAIQGLEEEEFEVDIIGPNLYSEQKSEDIEAAKRFIETTNGVNATFEEANSYLLFHKKKSSLSSSPWNVDLSIGPNIRIPVSAYIKIEDKPLVKWSKTIKDPVSAKPSTTEGISTEKVYVKEDGQKVADISDVIQGYRYGQRIIPFTECDKKLLYNSGEKCLSLYGFTKANSITWQNLNGDGLRYVFGRKGNLKAQSTIKCLVRCLHELNLVAIVRRVYNKGNAPKMYVLMPVIDTMCLSLIGICYKDDYKVMAFPQTNLKKYACSEDQVNAFKDLIKAMDLTKAYDETFDDMEAFPVAETVSPIAQYVFDCLIYRSQHPDKPLPPPRDEIMSLFQIPPEIQKKSKDPLEKLSQLFDLIKIEKKVKTRKQNNVVSVDDDVFKHPSVLKNHKQDHDTKLSLPPVKKEGVDHIGTLHPIEDFKCLIAGGKSFIDLCKEITAVIEKMFFFSIDDTHTKALNTMRFLREQCVVNEPSHYNEWLKIFKQTLTERRKMDLLSCINDNKLSYIVTQENSLSSYTEDTQEDSQLYENDTIPDVSSQMSINSEVNDLFDAL